MSDRRYADLRRLIFAMQILDGGMAIWDRWGNSSHMPFRREALKQKTMALVESDRVLTGWPRG